MTYTSGTATDLAWNDLRSKTAKNGTSGGIGSNGGTFGEIYTDSHVMITATGGAAGTAGGATGAYGKSLFMKAEISTSIMLVAMLVAVVPVVVLDLQLMVLELVEPVEMVATQAVKAILM